MLNYVIKTDGIPETAVFHRLLNTITYEKDFVLFKVEVRWTKENGDMVIKHVVLKLPPRAKRKGNKGILGWTARVCSVLNGLDLTEIDEVCGREWMRKKRKHKLHLN